MTFAARRRSTDSGRGRARLAHRMIVYRTIEIVERVGQGNERQFLGEFESEDEAIGQARALQEARGGYLVVERVETRVVQEIGTPATPRIVVPGSPYYATSPRGDGIYHLRSERGPLPEKVLFTFDREARVVLRAIADAANDHSLPF